MLGYERQGHFFKRTSSVDHVEWHLELDERYVRSVLDKSGMAYAESVVTPWKRGGNGDSSNCWGKVLGPLQPSRPSLTDLAVPAYERDKVRNNIRNERSDASSQWGACKKSRESCDTSEVDRDVC